MSHCHPTPTPWTLFQQWIQELLHWPSACNDREEANPREQEQAPEALIPIEEALDQLSFDRIAEKVDLPLERVRQTWESPASPPQSLGKCISVLASYLLHEDEQLFGGLVDLPPGVMQAQADALLQRARPELWWTLGTCSDFSQALTEAIDLHSRESLDDHTVSYIRHVLHQCLGDGLDFDRMSGFGTSYYEKFTLPMLGDSKASPDMIPPDFGAVVKTHMAYVQLQRSMRKAARDRSVPEVSAKAELDVEPIQPRGELQHA